MRAAKSRRLMGQMNVVPYIDVMLVLLIIFMVTAPMLQQGITVDLPEVESAPIEVSDDNEPLVVSINAAGELFINIGDNQDDPVSEEEILRRVAAVVSVNAATPVLIKGDEALSYGRFARALALLKQAGAPNVGLLTETPSNLPELEPE
jgi:biopolymer transport protein TolR